MRADVFSGGILLVFFVSIAPPFRPSHIMIAEELRSGRARRMGLRRDVADFREQPTLTREDLFFCLQLPLLFLCSWLLPQRWWPPVCYGLERAKAAIGVFSPRSVAAAARKALPELTCRGAKTFAIRHAARRSQHHLEILRTYRPGDCRFSCKARSVYAALLPRAKGRSCGLPILARARSP